MKVLSLSDIPVPFVYSTQINERLTGIDLAIDCGDLPYEYIEYIISKLDVDLFFVRGNHSKIIENTTAGERRRPEGAVDLHKKVINYKGTLLAGIQGSGRYREGPFQYTQSEMWQMVYSLAPSLLLNKLRYGRFLDIFVSHAPPWGIHDEADLPHQGIKAFRWLLDVFQPAYHFHGHIHVYHPDTKTVTRYKNTTVINTFGYQVTELDLKGQKNA